MRVLLAEAFGRPYQGGDSLQRHPVDASALADEKLGDDEPDDPWRNPAAPAALGEPAVAEPKHAATAPQLGKLGVRDVLFGGRVSYRALAILGITALLVGMLGGWVGRKTAEADVTPASSR